jgi:dCTP deaminase
VILSDRAIRREVERGGIEISPFDERLLQPASIDVRLGDRFLLPVGHTASHIDPTRRQGDLMAEVIAGPEGLTIAPGRFMLATTLEWIRLSTELVAHLDGKSSLGRLGLLIHSTSGLIAPGWEGRLTLNLSNIVRLPIKLYPGMPIGQITVMQLDAPAQNPYGASTLGSKYQGQSGPGESRFFEDAGGRAT